MRRVPKTHWKVLAWRPFSDSIGHQIEPTRSCLVHGPVAAHCMIELNPRVPRCRLIWSFSCTVNAPSMSPAINTVVTITLRSDIGPPIDRYLNSSSRSSSSVDLSPSADYECRACWTVWSYDIGVFAKRMRRLSPVTVSTQRELSFESFQPRGKFAALFVVCR